MQDKRRWVTSICKEAAKADIKMPWTRGAPRAAFIAKRDIVENGTRQSAQA